MRSGLTYDEAKQWEICYIAHYGRIDLGTGILRNQTDGGEGNLNPSDETRYAIGSARRGVAMSDSTKALISQAAFQQKNRSTDAMIAANKVRMASAEGRAAHSKKMTAICNRPDVKAQRSALLTSVWANKAHKASRSAAIQAAKAAKAAADAFEKYGIKPNVWLQLTKAQKDYAPKWLPIAKFMGISLLEYAALTRSEKLAASRAFKAA